MFIAFQILAQTAHVPCPCETRMQLLAAVCRRLVRVNMAPLVSGLLLVLSRGVRDMPGGAAALVEQLGAITVTLPSGCRL